MPPRCVINLQNKDNQCFKWAVLSALYPVADHPERVSKYIPNECKLNWTGINFPATIKDVVKFEKINPDVSLCVYKFEGKFPRPIFVSSRMNLEDTPKYREVDLLVIEADPEDREAAPPRRERLTRRVISTTSGSRTLIHSVIDTIITKARSILAEDV